MSQEEDDYWAGKLLDARHGQLDTVRKAAASWSTLFTATLGLFGTVTFVSGLTGLNDLPTGTRLAARWLIVAAAVLTLAATILAASAANSMPRVSEKLTSDTYQSANKTAATNALRRLRIAMGLGAVAASVVVAGSIVVLFSDKSSPSAPHLLVEVNGKTYCGTPSRAADGTLRLGAAPLDGASLVTTVTTCP
jgi:hypothetical protein